MVFVPLLAVATPPESDPIVCAELKLRFTAVPSPTFRLLTLRALVRRARGADINDPGVCTATPVPKLLTLLMVTVPFPFEGQGTWAGDRFTAERVGSAVILKDHHRRLHAGTAVLNRDIRATRGNSVGECHAIGLAVGGRCACHREVLRSSHIPD